MEYVVLSLAVLVLGIFGAFYILMYLFHLYHRAQYPQDAKIVQSFLDAAKNDPGSFKVTQGHCLKANNNVFEANSIGSLNIKNTGVCASEWNQRKITKAVKALWNYGGRHDPSKAAMIAKMKPMAPPRNRETNIDRQKSQYDG